MVPDEERAAAFARWYDEQVCTRIEPWRFGTQFIDRDFPDESDTNFVRLDDVPHTTPPANVVVSADAALADLGSPRRVVIGSIAVADRLAVAFEAAGWVMRRYLLLVHHAEPEPPSDGIHCEEVALGAFLKFRATFGGMSASRAYLEKVESRVGSRYFVTTIHGHPASGCVLWTHGGDAQIDAVATAPTMRGRGAGAAVVFGAMQAANADWVHLYTEAAAGPLPFYKGLGFEIAGAIAECTIPDQGEIGSDKT
jgi:ribosomal protein S18 acetylase RimI-like enzyme